MYRSLLVVCAAAGQLAAAVPFSPARYVAGEAPGLPTTAVGGGQVLVDLTVDSRGRVADARLLRATPPFSDVVMQAVRGWQFTPAMAAAPSRPSGEPPVPVPTLSHVLVAAVYRPPSLNAPTLGERPRDVARPSDEVAFPTAITVPAYPPRAFNAGVVVLEVLVEPDGAIGAVETVRSAPPFDEAARSAVRAWQFLPARERGAPVAAFVYVVFGFPVPVGPGRPAVADRRAG